MKEQLRLLRSNSPAAPAAPNNQIQGTRRTALLSAGSRLVPDAMVSSTKSPSPPPQTPPSVLKGGKLQEVQRAFLNANRPSLPRPAPLRRPQQATPSPAKTSKQGIRGALQRVRSSACQSQHTDRLDTAHVPTPAAVDAIQAPSLAGDDMAPCAAMLPSGTQPPPTCHSEDSCCSPSMIGSARAYDRGVTDYVIESMRRARVRLLTKERGAAFASSAGVPTAPSATPPEPKSKRGYPSIELAAKLSKPELQAVRTSGERAPPPPPNPESQGSVGAESRHCDSSVPDRAEPEQIEQVHGASAGSPRRQKLTSLSSPASGIAAECLLDALNAWRRYSLCRWRSRLETSRCSSIVCQHQTRAALRWFRTLALRRARARSLERIVRYVRFLPRTRACWKCWQQRANGFSRYSAVHRKHLRLVLMRSLRWWRRASLRRKHRQSVYLHDVRDAITSLLRAPRV